MKRFVCRFAVGRDGLAYSGVWRVWTAKNKPDLYIAVRKLGGELKATVHAPHPPHTEWERHFGFDKHAASLVSQQAKQDGGPHKIRWTGYKIGPDTTVEYRVIIRGTSLEETGDPVSNDVVLLPTPSQQDHVEVCVILGPKGPTSNYPRERDAQTYLVGEGRMSDDRRVWIVYVVRPNKENEKVNSIEGGPIEPESSFIDPNADLSSAKLRGIGFGAQTDGSLLFLDLKGHLASVKIVGHTAVKIKPRPAVKREARGGLGAMDLSAASVELIRQWAARTEAVREVWLFGSRAKGASSPDSDVDIGIYLMPPTATSDWALAAYTADGDAWQYELERLLGLPVSLEAVTTNSRGHREVQAGVRLWARTCDA